MYMIFLNIYYNQYIILPYLLPLLYTPTFILALEPKFNRSFDFKILFHILFFDIFPDLFLRHLLYPWPFYIPLLLPSSAASIDSALHASKTIVPFTCFPPDLKPVLQRRIWSYWSYFKISVDVEVLLTKPKGQEITNQIFNLCFDHGTVGMSISVPSAAFSTAARSV